MTINLPKNKPMPTPSVDADFIEEGTTRDLGEAFIDEDEEDDFDAVTQSHRKDR